MELQLIQNKIYELRGCKVMLDFDLAEMYQVETKNLNLAVKRNIKRFPLDFMFQLTTKEWENLRFQFATSSWGGRRYMPFAFTEQGVAMLSSVLRSETAIEVNVCIMRAFVTIRQRLGNSSTDKLTELQQEVKELKKYVEEVFSDYNDINEDTRMQLELVNETLAELSSKQKALNKPRNPIGFRAD